MDGPKSLQDWIQYLHAAAQAKQADPSDTEAQEAIDFAMQRIQRLQTAGTAQDVQAGEAESRGAMAGAGHGIAQGLGALNPGLGIAARQNPEATAALSGGILHGASLGTGELIAGAGSAARGRGFRVGAQGYRDATQALEEAAPGAFGAGDIIGNTALGAVPITRGLQAGTAYARSLPAGTKPLARFLSGVAHTPIEQGAALGGLAGASVGGEDPGDFGARLKVGAVGAGAGAALQGLFGGLGGLRVSRFHGTPDNLTPEAEQAMLQRELEAFRPPTTPVHPDIRLAIRDFEAGKITGEDLRFAMDVAANRTPAPASPTRSLRPAETASRIPGTQGRGIEVRGPRKTPPATGRPPTILEMQEGRVPAKEVMQRSLERGPNRPRPGHPIFSGDRAPTRSKEVRGGERLLPEATPELAAEIRNLSTAQLVQSYKNAPQELRDVLLVEFQRRRVTIPDLGIAPPSTPARGSLPPGRVIPEAQITFRNPESGKVGAYHGSPHKFEAFSMEKVGTGEGAQAYGHGLYFAENPQVARAYRSTLSTGQQWNIDGEVVHSMTTRTNAQPINYAANAMQRFDGDKRKAIMWLRTGGSQRELAAARILRDAKSVEPASGATYHVEIDAEPHQFLDWDKPLSQQSPEVRASLRDYPNSATGQDIYRDVAATPEIASVRLKALGIKGIRYLDQGSRPNYQAWRILSPRESTSGKWTVGPGGPSATKAQQRYFDTEAEARAFFNTKHNPDAGTYNYVVFDDKLVKIINREGFSGAALLGPLAAAIGGGTTAAVKAYDATRKRP